MTNSASSGPASSVPDDLSEPFALAAKEIGRLGGDVDLDRLCAIAAATVPHSGHAAITFARGEIEPRTIARSGPVPESVDALQYAEGEGPCVEVVEGDDYVVSNDLHDEPRWPKFAKRAVDETPVRAMLAVRLGLPDTNRAAFNFYAEDTHSFDDDDVAIASIFGALASVAMQRNVAQEKIDNLSIALESSRQIGIAIGILMARRLVTRDEAFEQLRAASQTMHRKLRDIAVEVSETGDIPDR